MSARIPIYVLKAGVDVIHTWADWMNEEDADQEGLRMDAHAEAVANLQAELSRDPMVLRFLRDFEIAEYVNGGAS